MAGKLLLLLLPLALCRVTPRLERVSEKLIQLEQVPSYKEMWFQEDLDHINRDPGSIGIRVLKLNSPYSLPTGPLIVYTGNEGPIEQFFNMSGFITTVLPNYLNCTIYFLEHRYYGKSLPSPFTWGYLSTEQVLYDYADIIQQLRPTNSTPVIVMGGSYGGMLAAWMRLKYTHIVDGAIASSAPVFMGLDDGAGYFANVTGVLNYYGCSAQVKQAFTYLTAYTKSKIYWPVLSSTFNSCREFRSPNDFVALNNWLINAFAGVVQSNYPGNSNVDTQLPSWPANATCQYFSKLNTNAWSYVQALAGSMQVYYNTSGTAQCFDITGNQAFTPNGWDFQTCTELWCPQGTTNVTDVFPPFPWDPNTQISYCRSTYGVTPRPEWIPVNYGMTPINAQRLKYASNIFFANGQLDPWLYGCVTSTTNKQLTTFTMAGGAHHTDLRTPTPQDPQDVVTGRQMEIQAITGWVNAKKLKDNPTPTYG